MDDLRNKPPIPGTWPWTVPPSGWPRPGDPTQFTDYQEVPNPSLRQPCWTSGPSQPLTWAVGAGDVIRTASFGTPVFDLRPDLRESMGNQAWGVPIWRPMGAATQIFFQVFGLAGLTIPNDLVVSAQEFAQIWDTRPGNQAAPPNIPAITDPEDISTEFMSSGRNSAIVSFFPTGSGYPVRYWRVMLTFETYVAQIAPVDAAIQVQAACY